ncbi:MAG: hypothetical protein M3R22_08130 [Pseudomonadota bacterium]|nr:hypothetical protein [Pseudomonadota bacterium]
MQTPKGTVHGFSNPFGSVARALFRVRLAGRAGSAARHRAFRQPHGARREALRWLTSS